ncbi:MAG: B12-binding domain-containing radical SAM protein [Nanobdellota archaeon]
MKILMVRPPRYLWAFHSERSSFWQPLGFASMAAVLRKAYPDVTVEILDCPVLGMGWKATKEYVFESIPDVVCLGEETVSAHEAVRLAGFVKEMMPSTVVVAGGPHFSYMVGDTLLNQPVDFVIRGEGEYPLRDLVGELRGGRDFSSVPNLSYVARGQIVSNPFGPPVDMESLPMAAYDLLPMDRYGTGARSHPDLVAVEHSRGCTCSCNFCVLWKQFGQAAGDRVVPCYRTKSPEKTMEEVQHLARVYDRKTFCWVDPTWNVDPKWNTQFAKLLIDSGLRLTHSVWMRADYLVRDEKAGIFARQVQAGVRQVMIGVERPDDSELASLEKTGYTYSTVKEAFGMVRRYPTVLSIATYIYGIPEETKSSLRRFYQQLSKIPYDIGVPIPLTPNPGTKYFSELDADGLLEQKSFRFYNFVNPVARSRFLSRVGLQIQMLKNEIRVHCIRDTLGWWFVGRLYRRRKYASKRLALSKLYMIMRYTYGIARQVLFKKEHNYSIKPRWY